MSKKNSNETSKIGAVTRRARRVRHPVPGAAGIPGQRARQKVRLIASLFVDCVVAGEMSKLWLRNGW